MSTQRHTSAQADGSRQRAPVPRRAWLGTLISYAPSVIIDDSHEHAPRLLRAHRRDLDWLADGLLDHETLDETEIFAATRLSRAPALEPVEQSTLTASSHVAAIV